MGVELAGIKAVGELGMTPAVDHHSDVEGEREGR